MPPRRAATPLSRMGSSRASAASRGRAPHLTAPPTEPRVARALPSWTDESLPIAAVNRRFAEPPPTLAGLGLRWVSRLLGQARRQYLSRLRSGYVGALRARRLGECRRCGSCCDLTFHCPFLTREGPCRIYDRRPVTCRDFPIDALDLRLTRAPCGHDFDEL